jgi:anti-sigma factor RsiW
VRCSSFEPLLDQYVEATLSPRMMAAVSEHVRRCDRCSELLTELRVVDALLATTKPIELAPNFTFAVMAEARATTIAPVRAPLVWAWLAFYLVAAWLAATGGYALFSRRLPPLGSAVLSVRDAVAQFFATIGAVSHAVAPLAPAVVTFVIAALLVDALLVATIFVFHRTVRPQLAARLAPLRQSTEG